MPSNNDRLVLLICHHLSTSSGDKGGYGVSIRRELERRSGPNLSLAAIYAALDRLEANGLVKSWMTEPRAERGGRSRRIFAPTSAGLESLVNWRSSLDRLWQGAALDAS